MNKFETQKYIKLLIFIPIMLLSCYDEPLGDISDEDSRVFISNYDKKINFKDYKSFYLSDTLILNNSNRIRLSVRNSDLAFIKYFRNKIEKIEYLPIKKNPDLGIQISRVTNSKIGFEAPANEYFNNYWGFSMFGNEGFEYPGYYKNYQISETIWNIEVIDLKNAVKNDKLKIIWNAQIIGNDIFNEDNYSYFIDKIFEISTFLPKEN